MLDKLNQFTESHGELEAGCGMQGDYMPNGFWSQLKFPFTWKG